MSISTQESPTIVAGVPLQIFVNRGWRDAKVLAILGQEALIEYQMPSFSGLRMLDLRTVLTEEYRDRHIRYEDLSSQWLQVIVDANQGWIGVPQQYRIPSKSPIARELPPPTVLLQQKLLGNGGGSLGACRQERATQGKV